jgi:hypothetical protein
MLDPKRIYYYAVCGIAFFMLMWGAVDLASTSIGFIGLRNPVAVAVPEDKADQAFDLFYQKKMLTDRLWDSLARVVVSGLVFIYFRTTASKLDKNVS